MVSWPMLNLLEHYLPFLLQLLLLLSRNPTMCYMLTIPFQPNKILYLEFKFNAV